MTVSALFVRSDSVYHDLGADCWDQERDARLFDGNNPVVAHPPCRAWGRLRAFAKPAAGERDLAHFAVATVRRCGGVLEHPSSSALWWESGISHYGRDAFGGFLIHVYQSWWGHRAPKPTGLYIVGIEPRDLPRIPFHLGMPSGRIASMGTREREATPVDLARWLMDVARALA